MLITRFLCSYSVEFAIPISIVFSHPFFFIETLTMRLKILSLLLSSTLALGNTLNVTVLGAQHNHSTLECWALDSGFKTSSEAGTAGTKSLDLGDLGGDSQYTILPAGFNGGRHNAPALQYVPAIPLPLAFQIHTLCLRFYI